MKGYYYGLKRALDILGATIGLIGGSPLILFSALLVWMEDRSSSPFLLQRRLGLHEKPFDLLKLRTMRSPDPHQKYKLTDAQRMLRTGKIFRKMSIDELPQLLNILRGEMSFIGPRPMPVAYQPYFRPEERLRHSVRPGISGLAQVNGRNFLSWNEKFALDLQYVGNFGAVQDAKIFFLTLWKVLIPTDVGIRGENLPVQSLHEVREPWDSDTGSGREQPNSERSDV